MSWHASKVISNNTSHLAKGPFTLTKPKYFVSIYFTIIPFQQNGIICRIWDFSVIFFIPSIQAALIIYTRKCNQAITKKGMNDVMFKSTELGLPAQTATQAKATTMGR